MTAFETIIDYVHQRLIFIRVDSTGKRLASAPGYTIDEGATVGNGTEQNRLSNKVGCGHRWQA